MSNTNLILLYIYLILTKRVSLIIVSRTALILLVNISWLFSVLSEKTCSNVSYFPPFNVCIEGCDMAGYLDGFSTREWRKSTII